MIKKNKETIVPTTEQTLSGKEELHNSTVNNVENANTASVMENSPEIQVQTKTVSVEEKTEEISPMQKAANLKQATTNQVKRYFFMVVACALYSFSINFFIEPNAIVAGGASGLATLFHELWDVNIGIMTVVVNIPILILGFKQNGWRFILDCFLTLATLAVITDVMAEYVIPEGFNITMEDGKPNKLLAAIYAGVLQGISIGLFLKYKVSSGGTEMLGRFLHSKIKIGSIPGVIAVLDAMVVIAGAIALKTPENLLYVLILIFISSKVSDVVLMGLNKAKMCQIITNYPEEVSQVIMTTLKRGVTKIDGMGMYTGKTHSIIMVCVKPAQIQQLKNLIKYVDSKAFVMVSDVSEVYGEGFKHISV